MAHVLALVHKIVPELVHKNVSDMVSRRAKDWTTLDLAYPLRRLVVSEIYKQYGSLSNLGSYIGRRGLCAPGDDITSLGAEGKPLTFGETSVAAPFVTGAIALLWSAFPDATAAEIKLAVAQSHARQRITVVPPLLDAWAAIKR